MQGSIPWVGVGSVAFFSVILVLVRLFGLNLSVRASSVKEEEKPMKRHSLVFLGSGRRSGRMSASKKRRNALRTRP